MEGSAAAMLPALFVFLAMAMVKYLCEKKEFYGTSR